MYDVAVAGGGPAGSAVAIHLARAGRPVALLDRAAFPRPKACGEGLFPAGVAALRDLGVDPAVAGVPLHAVRFSAGRATVEAPLSLTGAPGFGVRRHLLDAALLEEARRQGAEVLAGVTVAALRTRGGRVTAFRTSAGDVEAKVFVAADGLHSRLRRLAGLDGGPAGGRFGVTGHVRLPGPIAPVVQVAFRRGHEIYITPVGQEAANVALLARRPGMRRFAGDLEGEFRRTVALALPGAAVDGPVLAAGPSPRRARRAWRANLLLAGDAAGFYDGITGEGMSAALRGAGLAATAITGYLEDGDADAFRRYDRARRALVRDSDLLARLSLTLGRDPRLAAFAIANLARRPETFARLVAVNGGELPLSALRPRDLLAMLAGL